MKLAICTNQFYPTISGPARVVEIIARYLVQFHSVTVFTGHQSGRNKANLLPLQIVDLRPRQNLDFMRKLQSVNPDVTLVYGDDFAFFKDLSIYKNNIKTQLVVALCGAKWLMSHSDMSLQFIRNHERYKALICHSVTGRDFKFLSEPSLSKIVHVIPNGVNLREFESYRRKESLAAEYKLDPSKKWILSVARCDPEKGTDHIKTIAQLTQQNCEFILVSSNDKTPACNYNESMWVKNKPASCHFIRTIPRSELLSFMRACNILLVTSEIEDAPLTVLEAMACELPWIGADVGNLTELRGGVCIRLPKTSGYRASFTRQGIESFASAINDVLSKPTLGKEGREQVESTFSWDDILPKYRRVLEQ